MSGEIVQFPGDEKITIDVDLVLEKVAGMGNDPCDFYKAAVSSMGSAHSRLERSRLMRDFKHGDAVAFYHELTLAYFALGAMIGANRRMMVDSIRPRHEA